MKKTAVKLLSYGCFIILLLGCNDKTITPSQEHFIGEKFDDGVIFHLFRDSARVQHGLIVSMADLPTSDAWSNVSDTAIGLTAQSRIDGRSNSEAIIAQNNHKKSAAKACLDLPFSKENPWYLPSIDELRLLNQNLFDVNRVLQSDNLSTTIPIGNFYYWSSTEKTATNAWDYNPILDAYGIGNKSASSRIRAIKRF